MPFVLSRANYGSLGSTKVTFSPSFPREKEGCVDISEMAEYDVDNSPYFCLWNTASNNSSRPMVEHLGGPVQVARPWSVFLMQG